MKPISRTVGLMMVIMFAGKFLGIWRDRLQGMYLGADTVEGIAFMQASTLPRLFFDIIFASVFSASFIPIFNDYLETKGKQAAYELASLFITVVLVLTAAVTLLCVLFTVPLYGFIIDGDALTPETRALGINLLRIMFPLMTLSGVAFALTGVLQSLGEFRIPAAMSVVSNVIILLYYGLLFDRFGVYGLCVAFLIGWASQAFIQIPFFFKHRIPFRPRFNLNEPGLKQIGKLTLPVIAASWVVPVNLMVNGKVLNMYAGAYDYTGIHYAHNIFAIVSGVFVLSVANVVFPTLSKQTALQDTKGYQETLRNTVRSLFFFLLPMTFGLMTLSTPLIRLVYYGRLFDDTAVAVTGNALFYFSAGIVGYGLQMVLSRACYARQDGKTPMTAALFAIVLNGLLSFWLVEKMNGAGGVALASSVSITASAAVMVLAMIKKGYVGFTWRWGLAIGKMMVLSLMMFGVIGFIADGMNLFIVAGIGAVVYLMGGWLLGLEEMKDLKKYWLYKSP